MDNRKEYIFIDQVKFFHYDSVKDLGMVEQDMNNFSEKLSRSKFIKHIRLSFHSKVNVDNGNRYYDFFGTVSYSKMVEVEE